MVGRGLRLYPGKQRLELIDCVGITGKASLCTAPSLLGIDMDNVPKRKEKDIEGDLFELPEKIEVASDSPESWVKNIHLGPTLPAFLSPNVAKVLTDTFGIAGIGTVEEDLNRFFG